MPRSRSDTSGARPRWILPLAVVVAAGIAATALLVSVTQDEPRQPQSISTSGSAADSTKPTAKVPAPTPTTKGTIAVLGDSFVAGFGGDTDYVAQMAPLLGVKTAAFGQVGTGFVNYGQGLPYDQRLATVLATKPVALVVQASVNDYQTPTDAVVAAARTLINHARSLDEDLPIAIVGPIYLDFEAQPSVLDQRAALRSMCAEEQVTYIDPSGWITDDTKANLIGPDNLHPTNAGYTRIATRLAAALESFVRTLK